MYDTTTTLNLHPSARRRWLQVASVITVGVVLVVLTACSGAASGPGVATVGSSATPSTSSTGSTTSTGTSALAFSQCMRAHGITAFPDPNSQGAIAIQGGPGGSGSALNPRSPQFEAAQKACQGKLPTVPPAQRQQFMAQALKYSQCMRSNGVTDFPDPNARGMLAVQASPGTDLDPNSPTFQAAQKACQSFQPGGAHSLPTGGSGSDGGSGSSVGVVS